MENDNLALAKEAFKIVSDVRAVIAKTKGTNEYVEEDLKHLDKMINGYKGAKKLLIGERECAFAAGWMVSMANNAVFLAYRRNVATPEIEAAYRKLPSTEAAMKDYEKFMNEDNEKAKALEAEKKVNEAIAQKVAEKRAAAAAAHQYNPSTPGFCPENLQNPPDRP